MNKKLKFNIYYNNDGESLESLIVESIARLLNEKQIIGLYK